MEPSVMGIAAFVVLFGLIFAGLPIVVAAGLVGTFGLLLIGDWNQVFIYFSLIPYSEICVYSYTVVPLFIVMGSIAVEGGLAEGILDVAWKWLGRFKAGPAIVTIWTGAAFGAACGSNLAGAAMLAKLCVPVMRKYNYPDSFSTGCVAASGNLSGLIPPSTLMVLFGVITGTSVSKLLIAGLLPGLLLAIMSCVTVLVMSWRDSRIIANTESVSWNERFRSLIRVSGLVFIMAVIIGGLYTGAFTPTEAGSLGVISMLGVAAVNRRLNFRMLWAALKDAAITTAKIFVIVIGVMLLGRFLILAGVAKLIEGTLLGLPVPPLVIFLIVIAIYLFLGCFMDGASLLFLTLPVLFPIVTRLGYDPVWFGVIVVSLVGIAFITPPVGLNAFVVKGVCPEVPLMDIFRGAVPYVITGVLYLFVLMIFPQVALFLPSLMSK